MTGPIDNLPPAPWRLETTADTAGAHPGKGQVYILDGTGRRIASLWGRPAEKLATAALMCAARMEAAKGDEHS